ncbi:50S ribosomal protein L17 [Syncephalis pseudoplumigaleata]|uniref:50S ribosomal protein L17 n=1 Tax=Syncephalis pseudoplumigaleata TaxID=1712513 RepID=A0A4P9YQZ8_9FUNG|nr:50S ribosomal protein L17 [Syncephalis pseudoplumigaleata]|eukprot:RKP22263.1 50S ribosomal protein L17 [Syncephalis pseudoplumigaleata]
MYHGKHYRRFNRTSSHRQHMLRNLTTSLIRYGRIRTTLPKAKELRPIADHMVTLGKRNTPHAFNQARAYLREHNITIPRLKELAALFKERPGGYTRVLKAGFRQGDHAPMAYIELRQAGD